MAQTSLFARTMRSCILGAVFLVTTALPAYAASDIAIESNAILTTDYVFRGFTQTAENPAAQGEFDFTYKEIWYFKIFGSNVNFGDGPNGQDLANIEIDWIAGVTPTLGNWSFDIGTYYYTYPGASDPDGEFDYVEIRTGVSRSFFNERLELALDNYWTPENFGETGNNDVVEFNYSWEFKKVWYFTPTLSGLVGHQWGDKSQGGFDYTYWNVGLKLEFNKKPSLELDIRYWDTGGLSGFTCPSSGVNACDERVVGSLTATF